MSDQARSLTSLTAEIVAAYLSGNPVACEAVPALIKSVYATLASAGVTEEEVQKPVPAVSVKMSVKNDYLICLEDGKKLKTLKRHLMTSYGMTPQQYRTKWNLPSDYPMTAPAYSLVRSNMAKTIGLGRASAARAPEAKKTVVATEPKRRGRKPKVQPTIRALAA